MKVLLLNAPLRQLHTCFNFQLIFVHSKEHIADTLIAKIIIYILQVSIIFNIEMECKGVISSNFLGRKMDH